MPNSVIGATTMETEEDWSPISELGGTSHVLVPRNFRDVFPPVNEATVVTKLSSILKPEDHSEAARRLLCFAAAALPHQGTVQRSDSVVYPEQIGLHTGSGKLMSDAPQTSQKVGGRKGRKGRGVSEGRQRPSLQNMLFSPPPTVKHTGQEWSWIVQNFRIFIVSAVKTCKQCLQTASASSSPRPIGHPLVSTVSGRPSF